MTPSQIECVELMREGWILSADLLLRSPFGSSASTRVVHRQTFNGLLRRKLIERRSRDSNLYALTADGLDGPLIK